MNSHPVLGHHSPFDDLQNTLVQVDSSSSQSQANENGSVETVEHHKKKHREHKEVYRESVGLYSYF